MLSSRCRGDLGTCKAVFFFQAEDGIRDYKVTGVQTCALPIYVGIHFLGMDRGGGQQRQRGGTKDLARGHAHVLHQRDSTNLTRASRSSALSWRTCSRAASASPPCQRMASSTPRARQIGRASCRERV